MLTLADLLNKPATETPAKVALVHGERQLTYELLAAEIARCANALDELHGLPGNRIALLLGNGPEFLIAYFGAAVSGNVAVPLNCDLTPGEIAHFLNHVQASCLVTSADLLDKVAAIRDRAPALRTIVSVGGNESLPEAQTWEAFLAGQAESYSPRLPLHPESVAVFLTTSGTTGVPKAAMLTHSNLMTNVTTEAALYGLTGDDTFACVLPMFHNYALLDTCLLPLFLGATIVIARHGDTAELLEAVERHRVTFLATMPAQLTEMATQDFGRPFDTTSLRMVQTGGAALASAVRERFRECYGLEILEGYGCSEAASTVTVMPVDEPVRPRSVGKAMPNQQVRIVDEEGRPVGVGEEGEVVVRGPNVFRGYYGMPQLTRQTLRDGWLHTGDLGRLDAEGHLTVSGRKKSMINVGGMKVCPAEVEEVLHQIDGVRAACVVASRHPVLGETVKAFLEVPQGELRAEDVVRHCAERLGEWKVPRCVEVRRSLPRTGTGKVAVKALQQEDRQAWAAAA